VVVVSAAQICPAGSTEQLTNLLTNGDYANYSGWRRRLCDTNTPSAPHQQTPAWPSRLGSWRPQHWWFKPHIFRVTQRAAAGITIGFTTKAMHQLAGAAYRIWSQTVTGLVGTTSYEWRITAPTH
jgi:hypothetical protein